MLPLRTLFLNHLAQTSDAPISLEIEKAEGTCLYDTNGNKYIDLISGISVSNTGHRHPEVIAAINKQLDKYLHVMVYGEYILSPQVMLAKFITELLPEKLNSVYFVNSGSEAVEGAVKLAKRFTGKTEIIAFKNAYHGSTQGALSLMGNEEMKNAFRPLLPDIRFSRFNNIEDIESISEKTACVIVEPIQGEAGVRIADKKFLSLLRKKCDAHKCLLIFDEIQTGGGRTGSMFYFEQSGIIPDILLLAKGIGGGMPLGAFIADKKILNTLSHNPVLGHITTFGGHPVSCAAALANLKVIKEEKLFNKALEKEKIFRSLLHSSKIKEIRSKGLLMAVQLDSFRQVSDVITFCKNQGVITDWFLFCDAALRIAPPLIISEDEIAFSCDVINKGIKKFC